MSFYYVIIYYGPCELFHTLGHRPQKLRGLRDRLLRLGYRVDLRPMDLIDLCILEMCGHEIFRCNIKNLHFNMPHNHDPVCKRAILTVLKASELFYNSSTYLWCRTLIEDLLFKRDYKQFIPKEVWPGDVELEHFGKELKPIQVELESFDVKACVDCCDLLVFKKTEEVPLVQEIESDEGFIGFNS